MNGKETSPNTVPYQTNRKVIIIYFFCRQFEFCVHVYTYYNSSTQKIHFDLMCITESTLEYLQPSESLPNDENRTQCYH